MPSLRLLSVDARSYSGDRAGLAAAIGAAAPQVAFVHGAPHLARWRSLSAEIARHAGLVVVGGGRVGGANLILSTLGIDFVSAADTLFTHNPLKPAGISVARLRRSGTGFAVAAASLGTAAPGTDEASLRRAVSDVAELPLVLSIAGSAANFADLGRVAADRFVFSATVSVTSVERRDAAFVLAEVEIPAA